MDEKMMRIALEEAQAAYALGEVPVGAIIAQGGHVITRAHNLCEAAADVTAHAEMLCIREASRILGGRLSGCTLYCTLEPCAMCTGAILLARIPRVVFGAFDSLAGCCGSVIDMTDHWFQTSTEALGGVLEHECVELLQRFFKERR